ncbi:hypothetical protein U1Q18_025563 [Sarracenia purpurea var. burkii]
MAFDPKPQLVVLLFSLSSVAISAIPSPSSAATVYDLLPEYGLPRGLLPDSVASYSLSDEGSFVVELTKPCYVQFEYLVYYEKRITGKLKYGSISELEGIQVQRLFLWFDVDEIKVDLPPADCIYFQVGFINKKLDVNQFKTVHSCRDKAFAPCDQSWKRVFELPTPIGDIQMLITE